MEREQLVGTGFWGGRKCVCAGGVGEGPVCSGRFTKGGGGLDVSALVVSGNDTYVGGYFKMVGGDAAYNIAKWNGSSWSALGSGMDGRVSALVVSGGDLYAGGDFTIAGGIDANHIAKW